jgi:hypothetical protein
MRYGIVINLDYNSHSYEACKTLWEDIRKGMIEAGFRQEGRLFTTDMDEEEACGSAIRVIEAIEGHTSYYDKRVYSFLKEFYGVRMECTVNLMLPPADSIEVEEC